MKLTIFGGTSPTGRLLIGKALESGHQVTAFVREARGLDSPIKNLTVVAGDALNPAHVDEAVLGREAVLSTLGPKGGATVMAEHSMRNIVTAMQRHGVKRLVAVSVAGVPVAQDRRGFDPAGALIKLLLRDAFADREGQLSVLQNSTLDWVAVRVPRLTDGPATGSVKAFFGRPSPAMKVTRADLAAFMLQQLTDDRWLKQAPILCN